jgi:hypothetical protein
LAACSRAAPPEPVEASAPATRPWILVTPENNCGGRGVPADFLRFKTGKGVEVWVDPNDPALDLKAIKEGAKPR